MAALTSLAKIRLISNISSSEVSDANINSLITEATKEIMSQINVKVIREKVKYIDNTRENKVNGSNTVYYIQNWKGKYLGDYDLSATIDTDDVTVYLVASDGTETTATVSSIDIDDCKITLSSAPASSYKIYITYAYTILDPDTPDPLLGLAATYLTCAYAYLKRDVGVEGMVKFGNVTINQKLSASYGEFYKRYLETIKQINSYALNAGSVWVDSNVKI